MTWVAIMTLYGRVAPVSVKLFYFLHGLPSFGKLSMSERFKGTPVSEPRSLRCDVVLFGLSY